GIFGELISKFADFLVKGFVHGGKLIDVWQPAVPLSRFIHVASVLEMEHREPHEARIYARAVPAR
ncbi:MAG TPA: hypothetical protein VNT22_10455, partial [Baekduia sp.]|nr:hypothetical protein [Baekduia sp.]